jgi:hypothetical protein
VPGISSVSISPATPSVQAGGTIQFSATVTCAAAGCNQNVIWTSSAGTVSASGLLSAPASGNATITVTSVQDPTKSASTTVTVISSAASLVSISVTPSTVSVSPGGAEQFVATGLYSDGSTANLTSAVTWNTSSASVATVSSGGMVAIQGMGNATISAGISGSATLIGASSVTGTGASTSSTLPSGLLLHWTFDTANISGTTVVDVSGNNQNGIISGSSVSVTGELGQALQFNGSNSSVATSNGAPLAGNLTVTCWINTTNTSRSEAIITKYDAAGSGTGYIFRTDPAGHLEMVFGGVNGGSISTPAVDTAIVNDGKWHHVAAVITLSQSVQFYVDGQPTSSVPVSIFAGGGASAFTVGVNPYTGFGTYFTGIIDDVQAYNRALGPSEISSVYSWNGN